MASILRTASLLLPPPASSITSPEPTRNLPCFAFKRRPSSPLQLKKLSPFPRSIKRFPTFLPFAAYGEATEAEKVAKTAAQEDSDEEVPIESNAGDDGTVGTEEKVTSALMMLLQSYKEALVNNDEARVADIEAFLLSMEDEKNSLEKKISTLTEELTIERDRVLRISADFDNFRKRTERERLSLMTNVQGEVIESLLPVLDNFERAKTQIKVETEGEEKVNNSYQSIYKQFIEILNSLGVEGLETVGNAFDPLLHEAIMREDSVEFEEGIITQEFRKGFRLGERLLRPSMVKVSAGPGPAKIEDEDIAADEDSGLHKKRDEDSGETSEESSDESGDSE
ncbi:uncharacterized protein [Typha angustifolia]|uniref:uncharacterized protein n=1 Tax=Typha angustifolia TaxID=59011 RepID=UPI003C2DF50E